MSIISAIRNAESNDGVINQDEMTPILQELIDSSGDSNDYFISRENFIAIMNGHYASSQIREDLLNNFINQIRQTIIERLQVASNSLTPERRSTILNDIQQNHTGRYLLNTQNDNQNNIPILLGVLAGIGIGGGIGYALAPEERGLLDFKPALTILGGALIGGLSGLLIGGGIQWARPNSSTQTELGSFLSSTLSPGRYYRINQTGIEIFIQQTNNVVDTNNRSILITADEIREIISRPRSSNNTYNQTITSPQPQNLRLRTLNQLQQSNPSQYGQSSYFLLP